MDTMALLLKEGMDIGDNQMAMDHLRTFYEQHGVALKKISHEFNGWYRFADPQDVTDFFKAINEQPSAKKLKQMVPAFRQRISYNLAWEKEFEILTGYMDLHR